MKSNVPIRRMFRISLSGLLLLVTLVGIGLGIYVRLTREARQQRAVVHLAWKHNAHIYFDHHIKAGQRAWPPPKNPPPANKLWRWILTDDYFRRVEVLDFSGSDVTDPELLTLQKLTNPFTLFLVECPKVTDQGIRNLATIPSLKTLNLTNGISKHRISLLQHVSQDAIDELIASRPDVRVIQAGRQ